MAQGRVDIILKAVDDYSGVLTGLNQGFELTKNVLGTLTSGASMAFNAIKSGAGMAFDGIKEAVDLAVKGGNYQELYNQLSNVAAHFKVDADAVMGTLDDLTDNVISMTDSVRLASKGIAAGFDKEELDTVFTFAKRRTEATGESFEMMAEQIINAMQKGRYTTLADMGLIIEKGMDTADILREIERATAQYGDTGFNTGDKIASLANQADKFSTKIGQAINQSWSWETTLNTIQDSVINFVNSFDYSAVTKFINGITIGFSQILGKVDFEAITRGLNDMINGLADAVNAPEFQEMMDGIMMGLKSSFEYILSIDFISIFKNLVSGISNAAIGIGNFIVKIVQIEQEFGILREIASAVGSFLSTVFEGIGKTIFTVVTWVRDFSAWLGELSVDGVLAVENAFNKVKDSIDGALTKFKEMFGLIEKSEKDMPKLGDLIGGAQQATQPTMVDGIPSLDPNIYAQLLNQHMQPTQSDAKSIDELFQAVNWPAEFQALGDFMFNWVLASASGSPIPMAITTAR